jgi:hypothetical protein
MSLLSQIKGINPWALYEHPRIDWYPHDSQVEVLDSYARHRVWCAGRRTGKSDLGGHVLLPHALATKAVADDWLKKGKRREYWIVGDEYVTAEKEFRVIWNIIKSLGIKMDTGSHYSADGKKQCVLSLWGGAFYLATQSAKYPENLVGEALHGVLMVEAAKSKPSTWQKFIRPMLNDYTGWSLHTSTPEGKNHFYDKFNRGQDPYDTEWASWRMPAYRNPFVYTETGRRLKENLRDFSVIPQHEWTRDDHIKFMLQQMEDRPGVTANRLAREYNLQIDREILDVADDQSLELFKQETMADFTEFVGQVFKEYDEEYHVGDLHFDPDWQTYAAADYGFTNPNVWLLIQVGPWSEINVLGEIYQPGLTADSFADEIIRRRTRDGIPFNPPGLRVFYPDPADPMSSKTLSDRLKITAAGGTGGELNTRINIIRQWLKQGRIDYGATGLNDENANVWRPRLMIDRSCTMLRSDMLAYRYPERKEDAETSRDRFELPLKKDDHGPEALGRFAVGKFGPGSLTVSAGTRVRKANAGRHAGPRNASRGRNTATNKPISAMTPVKSGYNEKDWKQFVGTIKDEDL